MSAQNATDDLLILQITDTHLYAAPDSTLLGMNTLESLQQVIAAALHTAPRRPDLILATGDLVHDASASGYRLFAEAVLTAGVPVYCLPGNHDDLQIMRSTLASLDIRVLENLESDHLRILPLDSTVPGEEGGRLAESELATLEASLAGDDRNTLICMHHQPVPVGSQWIDRIGTDNGNALLELASKQTQVKAVLFGHVHQTVDRFENQLRILATPSTCIQFEAGLDEFKISGKPPAARLLALTANGSIETEVIELETVPAGTRLDASGY